MRRANPGGVGSDGVDLSRAIAGAAGQVLDDERHLVGVQGFRKRLAVAVQSDKHRALVEGCGVQPGFEVTAGFRTDITLGAVASLVRLAAPDTDGAVLRVR